MKGFAAVMLKQLFSLGAVIRTHVLTKPEQLQFGDFFMEVFAATGKDRSVSKTLGSRLGAKIASCFSMQTQEEQENALAHMSIFYTPHRGLYRGLSGSIIGGMLGV